MKHVLLGRLRTRVEWMAVYGVVQDRSSLLQVGALATPARQDPLSPQRGQRLVPHVCPGIHRGWRVWRTVWPARRADGYRRRPPVFAWLATAGVTSRRPTLLGAWPVWKGRCSRGRAGLFAMRALRATSSPPLAAPFALVVGRELFSQRSRPPAVWSAGPAPLMQSLVGHPSFRAWIVLRGSTRRPRGARRACSALRELSSLGRRGLAARHAGRGSTRPALGALPVPCAQLEHSPLAWGAWVGRAGLVRLVRTAPRSVLARRACAGAVRPGIFRPEWGRGPRVCVRRVLQAALQRRSGTDALRVGTEHSVRSVLPDRCSAVTRVWCAMGRIWTRGRAFSLCL